MTFEPMNPGLPAPWDPSPEESSPPMRFPDVEAPVVSIVIPAWNQWELTQRCLVAVRLNTRGTPFEVIVVDNGSTDATTRELPRIQGIRIIRNDRNLGFAKASNQGARISRGKYVLFLNNDTEALPGWLPPLVEKLDACPTIGAAGSKLLFPNGTLQHCGVIVEYGKPHPIAPSHIHRHERPGVADEQVDNLWVTGACMLVRRDLFERLGGFDEGYLNSYEDLDLCFKLQYAGFGVAFVPQSVLIHFESMTPGRHDREASNRDRLHHRWLKHFWEQTRTTRPSRELQDAPVRREPFSVIVVSMDSLEYIVPCLEGLLPQLTRADQLILADGGSTDATIDFLSLFASELPSVASLFQGNDGPNPVARSAAWSARHANLAILPASFAPPEGFLDILQRQIGSASSQIRSSDIGGGRLVLVGKRDAFQKAAVVRVV